MEVDNGKRGRKAGIRGLKVHKFYGPRQAEICALSGTSIVNSVFVHLSFAYREAIHSPQSFKEYLDELLGETSGCVNHKAAGHIELWAINSGLGGTSWARIIAAKLLWKSASSPLRPYIHGNRSIDPYTFTLKFHLDAMLGRLYIKESLEISNLRRGNSSLPKELMLSYLYKCGYKNSPFGDFTPVLVAQWLGVRSVKVAEARTESKRIPGWDTLLADGTDHKTVKKHVLRMADYLGVPTTALL